MPIDYERLRKAEREYGLETFPESSGSSICVQIFRNKNLTGTIGEGIYIEFFMDRMVSIW